MTNDKRWTWVVGATALVLAGVAGTGATSSSLTMGPDADEDVLAECTTGEAQEPSLVCSKEVQFIIEDPDYTLTITCGLSAAAVSYDEDDDGVSVSVECVYGGCGFSLPATVAQ